MVINPTPTQILVELCILTNLGLKAIKVEMFSNTKVKEYFTLYWRWRRWY